MAKYSGIDGMVVWGTSDSIESVNDDGDTITITMTAHSFLRWDTIFIKDVVGMTDLNGFWLISAKSTNTITVPCVTSQSYISGGTIQKSNAITNWSLDISSEIKNVTDSSSNGNRDLLPVSVKQVSGSFDGFYLDNRNRLTYVSGVLNSTVNLITLNLHLDDTDNFEISCYITGESIPLSVSGGDAVKITYTFEGTSTLTETNA